MNTHSLIAPCGMNCGLCLAYQRDKNTCPGCRMFDEKKPESCQKCIIVNCEHIKNSESGFCYDCEKFPCKRLKQLDKRYRTKYSMSMLENLEYIKNYGLKQFTEKEVERWKCPNCGAVRCVHRNFCLKCKNVCSVS